MAKDRDREEKPLFDDETDVKFLVGMMCTVVIFIIGGPPIVFVMAMILLPEWQGKVRNQIDEVVGEDDMVDLRHGPQLPILREAILECVR